MTPILKVTEENCSTLIKVYSDKLDKLNKQLDDEVAWDMDTSNTAAEIFQLKNTLGYLNHFLMTHQIV